MNSKKIIATFLLIVLFTATVIGWGSYRLALATDTSTAEVTMEKLEEASTTESTEEASSESSKEEASTAVTTEVGLVEDEDVADTPSDLTTEVTTELASTENTTTEESTQTITSEDGTEFVTQDSNLVEEEVSADSKGANVTVGDDGSWGGGSHWYWRCVTTFEQNGRVVYEKRDSDKVLFCLELGYHMNRGTNLYSAVANPFKSIQNSARINTAIAWYKAKCGGLSVGERKDSAYQSAQLAIWGTPGDDANAKKIVAYAKACAGIQSASSFSGFKKVKDSDYFNNPELADVSKTQIKGTEYKTAASKYLKEWVASGNFSDHKKYYFNCNIYKANGTLSDKTCTMSITSDGRIKVKLSAALAKGEVASVAMRITGYNGNSNFFGSSSVNTLNPTKASNQRMSYSSNTTECYFVAKLSNQPTEQKLFPNIYIPKKDVLGNDATATYRIWWGAPNIQNFPVDFSSEQWVNLEYLIGDMVAKSGVTFGKGGARYADIYWQETSTSDGLVVDPTVHTIHLNYYHVTKAAGTFVYSQNGDDIVAIEGGENSWVWMICNGGGTTDTFENGAGVDGAPAFCWSGQGPLYFQFTYAKLSGAFINNVQSYPYSFTKTGEDVTVGGTKGNVTFNYPVNNLKNGAQFALYCDDTSVTRYNGSTVFSEGQQITSGTTWCNTYPCPHNPGHTVQLSGGGVNAVPINGVVAVSGLPEGSYHFVEVSCDSSFILNPAPISFYVGPGSSGASDEVRINTMLKAKVSVKKKNENKANEYLSGAEFTLYAKNTNTNNAGALLYPADWAEEAVISRTLGDDGKVLKENKEVGWVPVKTGETGDDGSLDFGDIPYGDYLIVETKPPVKVDEKGVKTYFTLAEKSIKFTHYRDAGANTTLFPNGITYAFDFAGYTIKNGEVDDKNIGNTKKTFDIKIYKHGDVVKSAEEIETPYGTYKHLVTEDAALNDVVFILTDAKGNYVQTLQTDENGYAKSEQLESGIYWLTERVVDKEHHYLDGPIKVDLSEQENNLAHVETKEIDIPNTLVTTQLSLYKNQEVPYITKDVLENPDKFPDVLVTDKSSAYTYNVEPLEGAIFGVYTKNDVKNYYGKVIVNSGDCVGYIRTDKDGKGTLNELLLTGDYYFKEIMNNREDVLRVDENQYDFTLTLNHNDLVEDLNKYQPVLNEYRKSSVKLIKKDGDTEILLPGVEFGLYDYKNNLINRYVTDENGEIRVDILPLQTYYFKELEALDGYYKNNERLNIVADEDKMLYTITAYNDKMYDDSEDQLTDRSDFNDKLKDIAGFWEAITDNPDFEEETTITDTPKLGTSIFVNIFCSLVLLMCVAGIAVIWMPKKKK